MEYYIYNGQIQAWPDAFPVNNECFQTGSRFEDSYENKYVKLSDDQVAFMLAHEGLSAKHIWAMIEPGTITPIPVEDYEKEIIE